MCKHTDSFEAYLQHMHRVLYSGAMDQYVLFVDYCV